MPRKRLSFSLFILLSLLIFNANAICATPGRPFTEDFTNQALMDGTLTNANWSTTQQEVYLEWATHHGVSLPVGSDITSDAHTTYNLVLADMNGDGHLDVVVGNKTQPNRLYLNNGTNDPFGGVLGNDITTDAHYTYALAVGDMDGDGDLDIVAGNNSGQANRLYLNNSTSNPFDGVTGSDITLDGHNTWDVAVADLDSDGDLDLIAGNYGTTNRIYLNNGTSAPFSGVTGSNITTDTHNTIALAVGDMDGDGALDIVAGNSGRANRLYLNNSTLDPFAGITGSDITSDWYSTWDLAVADVDGDGDLDLIAGNYGDRNFIYLNNGTSAPFNGVTGSYLALDTFDTCSIFAADMDGDGDIDLLVGNSGDENQLFMNNGTNIPFTAFSKITSDSHYTYSIVAADMDGDGIIDLVAGNNNGPTRLYLNNSVNAPYGGLHGSDITLDRNISNGIAIADMDGDGNLDVVAGDYNKVNRLYLSNGTTDPFNGVVGRDITTDLHMTKAIAVADVNGDGHIDVLASDYARSNRLYLNNGTSDPFNGVTGSNITGSSNTYALIAADMDGDGDIDVVTGNDGQRNEICLNSGTSDPFGPYAPACQPISFDAHDTLALAVADLDGDGNLDVIAGNSNQRNRFYLNNGTAAPFLGVTGNSLTMDWNNTWALTVGDMNGDENIDVIVGNVKENRLYLNNGTTTPFDGVTGSDISSDVKWTAALAVADMDDDGDLDLVVGYIGTNRLYLNNGTATPFYGVRGSDISNDHTGTWSLAVADMDGDETPDIVAGNDYQNRLYPNKQDSNNSNATLYSTNKNTTTSLQVNTGGVIADARLTATATANTAATRNTSIDYYMSNDGGLRWYQVINGQPFTFPATGTDLRWKARLKSLSPKLTPILSQIFIDFNSSPTEPDSPAAGGGGGCFINALL